jgi:DNA-binding NarL/FixJ family response regulator
MGEKFRSKQPVLKAKRRRAEAKPCCWWKTSRQCAKRRRSSFAARGNNILEATDGVNALSVAQQCQATIHLLVTDVVMPNMSGGELAKQIGQLRPDIKYLFVSG